MQRPGALSGALAATGVGFEGTTSKNEGLLPGSQVQKLALTACCVPYLLDSRLLLQMLWTFSLVSSVLEQCPVRWLRRA